MLNSDITIKNERGLGQSPVLNTQACFVCNSTAPKFVFKNVEDFEYGTYKPVDYVVCKDCRLISQNPLPEAGLLKTFYPDEYRNYAPLKKSLLSGLKNIHSLAVLNKFEKHFHKKAELKILEIGFGNGQLLLTLKRKGYPNVYGCDFTGRFFPALQKEGIKLKISDLEKDFPFNESFDVIIMINVIEHFLDPADVLRRCKNHLTEKGRVILITPNANALELPFFKRYWAGFHAPRHLFLFNEQNIKMLAEKIGFGKVKMEPFTDSGQISISVQNFFQGHSSTKVKLKNGMAWYLLPLSLILAPLAFLQNLMGRSTSAIYVLPNA